MAILHLEAKILSQKKAKKPNKIFDASRPSLQSTLVCHGTVVGNHCPKEQWINNWFRVCLIKLYKNLFVDTEKGYQSVSLWVFLGFIGFGNKNTSANDIHVMQLSNDWCGATE